MGRHRRERRGDYRIRPTSPRVNIFGFDESNHGRIPEVLVVAHSRDVSSAEKRRGQYPKIRKGQEGLLAYFGDGYDYRFMILPDKCTTGAIYRPDTRAVVTVELIHAFGLDALHGASIFIDGEHPRELEKAIYDEFRRRSLTLPEEVVYEADADRSYRVVNAADAIACVLFHTIEREGERGLELYSRKRVQHAHLFERK